MPDDAHVVLRERFVACDSVLRSVTAKHQQPRPRNRCLDLNHIGPIPQEGFSYDADQCVMAMRFDAFFEVAFSMRALQFSSLYQMHCLKPVEVGEAANVIERGLIGNQSDVELTPQPLQK